MNVRELLPIILCLMFLLTSIASVQAASSPSVQVIATNEDGYRIDENIGYDIQRNNNCRKFTFAAMLYVDGYKKRLRQLEFEIYNKQNKQIVFKDYAYTHIIDGVARLTVDLNNWTSGEYILHIWYEGTKDGQWPKTSQEIPIRFTRG